MPSCNFHCNLDERILFKGWKWQFSLMSIITNYKQFQWTKTWFHPNLTFAAISSECLLWLFEHLQHISHWAIILYCHHLCFATAYTNCLLRSRLQILPVSYFDYYSVSCHKCMHIFTAESRYTCVQPTTSCIKLCLHRFSKYANSNTFGLIGNFQLIVFALLACMFTALVTLCFIINSMLC